LRALGILLAVFQKPAPSVLIIEEPEATIHPGALGVILDALKEAAETTQLIVTTHCPDVLDAEWIEDRHIRMVDWKDGATRVSPLAESSRSALRDKLMSPGELLRANALVGEASERELLGT
jgi:predicted ATPase